MFFRRLLQRFHLYPLLAAILLIAAACAPIPQMTAVTPAAPAETPSVAPTAPASEPTQPPGNMPPAGDAPAVDGARNALAVELGVNLNDIRVVSVTPVDWRDGCLEVSRPDVMCLQVITPGFRIVLEVAGQQYEMRTDAEGQTILRAGAPENSQPPAAAVKAVAQLASQLGLALNEVRVISSEYVEWPDSCLGAGQANESCALVVTPGYRIILEANNRQYTFHTDAEGNALRAVNDAAFEGGTGADGPVAIIGWRETGAEGCTDVFLGAEGVRFGKCGEELSATGYITTTHRLAQLLDMQAIFAPFAAATPAGKVAFNGRGSVEPGPAEQRMIAEFAAAVYNEMRAGGGAAQWGLGWRRTGGIAGFCDDLMIDASGHATLAKCGGATPEEVGWRRLSETELEKFYLWLDTLGAFEYTRTDPATADAMTLAIIFAGRTEAQPSDAERDALIAFGADVLTQWAGPTDVRSVVARRELEIRSGPGPDFARNGSIPAGENALVTGLSRDEAWWRIACPSGALGLCYVSADPTMTEPAPPAPESPAQEGAHPAQPTATPAAMGQTTRTVGEADEAAILAAVIRRVYTVDHTFANTPNFPVVYLLRVNDTESSAAPFSGGQMEIPVALQHKTVAALSDLPAQFNWISDPNQAPRDANGLVQGNGAIITVGNIVSQLDGSVQVAASIYVGSLAAGGQTYVLQKFNDTWEITGKTGPTWIS